ncbi:hypothetical protein EVAR_61404_1 [Eumeta japonica]|uniref:Uncharacterized protein n=1 Tax=Eumeta variegata TaxID=151549 RepID=A0A4C1YXW9_EUMVA|nr:hypothetical protein EVAR_61404_1 [Eumeta japonica]
MLVDHSRSGRPSVWDMKATKEAGENDPGTSTCRYLNSLGPPKYTIQRRLKLGKTHKIYRIVLHESNELQAKHRVEIARRNGGNRCLTTDRKSSYNRHHKSSIYGRFKATVLRYSAPSPS